MEKVRGSRIESLFPSILWSRSEERISFSLTSLHFQILVLTSTWIAPGAPAAWVIAHTCAEVQRVSRNTWEGHLRCCDQPLYKFWYFSWSRCNSLLWVSQLAKNSFDLKSNWFLLFICIPSESWHYSEPLQMCQMSPLVTVVKYKMDLSYTFQFLLFPVFAEHFNTWGNIWLSGAREHLWGFQIVVFHAL